MPLALSLWLLAAAAAHPGEVKKAPQMTFAYSNAAGSALLAADNIDAALATGLDRGICDGGRIVTVKFTGMQREIARSTSRNDAANFDTAQGARFAVVGSSASSPCLLVKQSFLADKRTLSTVQQSAPGNKRACAPNLRSQIPALDKRLLVECTSLASMGTDAQLLAAVYAPRGDKLLAALVVSTRAGMFVHPLPGDGGWRADDDGELNAENMSLMFALAAPDGSLSLGLVWPGAEGDALSLYGTAPPGALEEVVTGYLYRPY